MKKLKFLLVLLMAGLFGQAYGQIIYADYDGTDLGFASWASATWSSVANPDPTGINTSDNVGQFGHAGNNSWTGVNCNTEISPAFDFASTPFFRMKVYASNPIKVVMKLENFIDYTINSEQAIQLTADQTNKWVELVFDFTGVTLTNLNRFTLFMDPEMVYSVAGTPYYFDDITASNVAPAAELTYLPAAAATNIPVFSSCTITSNLAFKNADGSAITDPTASMQLKKGGPAGTAVPFSASISSDKQSITVTPNALLDVSTTYWYSVVDNAFKYSGLETNVVGVGTSFTTGATAANLVTYANFDGIDKTVTLESMGAPAGALLTNVFDPTNTSNTVIQWDNGGSWWGWERIHVELSEPIKVSTDRVFSIRIYSPKVTYVRLKVSNQVDDAGAIYKETDAQVTKVNAWQTLYFEFPAFDAADYKHLLIFIDGGVTEANSFLIDDIKGPNFVSATSLFGGEKVSTLTVSPNPTTDILTITNVVDGDIVEVVNVAGEVVANLPVDNGQISLGSIKKGIYIVKVNGTTAKVVKQ